jgi:tetratricopeptide (TPR) repeat protein
MMKKIVLLYQDETPAITRMTQRLRSHFGPRRVVTCREKLSVIDDDDTVVALLSAGLSFGEKVPGGLPLNEPRRLEASGIGAVFAREGTVVPVLLDGAVMPPHTTLPETTRKLAFRHALPIRCDVELDRDLGRLIKDLEVHLQHFPGKSSAWDSWLLPIGIVGSVLCCVFLFLWLIDAWYWNYGYQTVESYHEARFSLTMFGPGLLGAFLMLTGTAMCLRRHRRRANQRTEHFHTGTGAVPPYDDPTVAAALVLSGASIGWGGWGSVPAILFVVVAIVRRTCGLSPRIAWRGVLVALVIAISAALWASWRTSVVDQFEVALGAYEQGIAAEKESRLPEAQHAFEAAIAAFPRFGHAYQGLGLVYARSNDAQAAYRELSNAIDRYPTEPRGLFDPDRDMVSAAYRNRAKVAEKLGQAAQAESDNKKASELTPFMDIFGGFFRWW